ncbi:MAG: tRNA 2-thiouridine(34) synthase MnmA [Roseiarcus sp.]
MIPTAPVLVEKPRAQNSLGLDKAPADTRVVVAMSGGVDSSVVAAMLARAGYDVVGLTMQLYDHGAAIHRKGACCAGQDIYDAREVASRIGIPHYVLDYEERFREKVIEPFAEAYVHGETPIPCVACNQHMKFVDLIGAARDLGADLLATGHYVVAADDGAGGRALYRAADPERDQSYFLFATTREQLKLLRFPLGPLPKSEVRALAREFSLAVADKADSQDICFVPAGHYSDMIERLRPGAAEPGDIVHADGRVLGRHDGILHYTIGQRRGIGVAAGEPLYVIKLDAERARVIVGPRRLLATPWVKLRDFNWIGPETLGALPASGLAVAARVRSTRPPAPARLYPDASVDFDEPELGVSPGQACVIYDSANARARILGGGFIAGDKPIREAP